MNEPLVSIIIPVYNSEKYIAECLHSVFRQEYQNIEVIVVDDGSSDKSHDICISLAAENHCLKVFHKDNGGVSAARNFGLDKCNGEFVAFIDSDDFIEPHHIKSLVGAIGSDIDCSICGYFLDYRGKTDMRVFYELSDMNTHQAMLNMLDPSLYQGFLCNKLFRKKIIDSYHIRLKEDIFYCEDLLFCAVYFRFSSKISCTASATYHYRQHSESFVNRQEHSDKRTKHMLTAITAFRKCAELYNDSPEVVTLALARAGTEYARIFRRVCCSKSDARSAADLLRALRTYRNVVIRSSLNSKEKIKFISTCIMPKTASKFWTARETKFLKW